MLCSQQRNLSDNLLFSEIETAATGRHKFYFTVLARSGVYGVENISTLAGFIFIHENCPVGMPGLSADPLDVRGLQRALAATADFAVGFVLARDGAMRLLVSNSFADQEVRYGDDVALPPNEALRPLVAQCFYFLRDITHRHHHHSKRSDAITSVWGANDPSRWIRETLYELHRRVIVARRVRSPRGQEDALGFLAYASTFEQVIAGPFRKSLPLHEQTLVPVYQTANLKDSISATLEVKRRRRIQRNVVAAAAPALFVAMLGLANNIVPKLLPANEPNDLIGWLKLALPHPVEAVVFVMSHLEWAFPLVFVIGLLWVLGFTGQMVPSEMWPLKGLAQLFATRGKGAAVTIFLLIAAGVLALGVYLLFASPT